MRGSKSNRQTTGTGSRQNRNAARNRKADATGRNVPTHERVGYPSEVSVQRDQGSDPGLLHRDLRGFVQPEPPGVVRRANSGPGLRNRHGASPSVPKANAEERTDETWPEARPNI